MAEGTVKWFNEEKGHGFITPDGGSADVFVHYSEVHAGRSLQEGDRVNFEVVAGTRGPQATQVRTAEDVGDPAAADADAAEAEPSPGSDE